MLRLRNSSKFRSRLREIYINVPLLLSYLMADLLDFLDNFSTKHLLFFRECKRSSKNEVNFNLIKHSILNLKLNLGLILRKNVERVTFWFKSISRLTQFSISQWERKKAVQQHTSSTRKKKEKKKMMSLYKFNNNDLALKDSSVIPRCWYSMELLWYFIPSLRNPRISFSDAKWPISISICSN